MAKFKITNEKELQANIKRLEGGFRSDVHMVPTTIEGTDDTVDIPHIGYGFKIDKKDYAFYNLLKDGTQDPSKPAYVMSKDVAEKRFLKEYNKAHKAAKKLAKEKNITGFERIAAFTDIAYNMGTEWHLKFPSAMKALDNGDYLEFTKELLRGQDKSTKSKYVKDVGIERLTQNTLPFGYDHTEAYNSGALYKYESNVVESNSFLNMGNVDLNLGTRKPASQGDNTRFTANLDFFAENNLGSIAAKIDDQKNVYGKASVKSPIGTFSKDTDKNNVFVAKPFKIGNTNIRAQTSSNLGPRVNISNENFNLTAAEEYVMLNIDKLSTRLSPYAISAEYNVSPGFVIDIQKKFQRDGDVSVGFNKRTNFLGGNLSYGASQTSGGESKAGFNFRKTFEEGGEIKNPWDEEVGIFPPPDDGGFIFDDPTQPSLTSPVLPNETVQPTGFVDNIPGADTVDTTQGFYSVNPAPGESGADFEQRTMQYTQPVDIPKVKSSSYRPPEGYVSPRVSNPFMGGSGKGTPLDYTDTSGLGSTSVALPTDSGLSESELALLTVLGTASDVMAGEDAKDKIYPYEDRGVSRDVAAAFANNSDFYNMPTLDGNLDIFYGGVADLRERFSTIGPFKPTTEIGAFVSDKDGTMKWVARGKVGDPIIDSKGFIKYAEEMVTDSNITYDLSEAQAKEIMSNPKKYGVEYDEEGNLVVTKKLQKRIKNMQTENFFEKLGKTHLFTMQDGTYNVELKDLYDEFTAAILVGAVTGDAGKAAIAGGTQFIKSEVIESFAMKAGATASEAILKAGGTEIAAQAASDAASKKWTGFGGAAVTMAGVLALGGDEEAALTAGVQHLVTKYGAEAVGEFVGGGEALGGATIAAVVSFLRTGDVKQAAMSGATSYLFSVNPVLGIAAMALQFLTAKKPSYKSGYASFDFDEFKMNTYSQGDYDSSKANPSNVEFSKKLLDPMIPYMKELEKTTGFNFKGDLQIHYSQGKKGAGVHYTIGNRDQEGLDAKGMFLNRLDYYDGRDQSTQDGGKVYRKHFQPTQEGLEAMYESIYADLAYISENKITDLTHYTGVVKSAEEIQAGLKNTGFDMGSLSFMEDGGFVNTGYLEDNSGFVNTGYLEDNVEPNVYDEKPEDKRDTSDYITEGYLDSIEFYNSRAEENKLTGDLETYKKAIESKEYYIKKYREEFKEKTGEYPPEEAYTFFEGPSVDSDFQEEMVLKKIDESKNKGFRMIGRGKVPETWRDNEKTLHEQVMKWQDSNAFVSKRKIQEEGYSGDDVGKLEIISGREKILYSFNNLIKYVKQYGIDHKITKEQVGYYIKSIDNYENTLKTVNKEYPLLDMSKWDYSMLPNRDSDWDALAESLRGTSELEQEEKRSGIVQPRDEDITEMLDRKEKEREYESQGLPIPGETMAMVKGGKIPLDKNQKVLYNSNQAKNYGLVDKKGKAPPSMRADDVPMTLKEGDFVLSQPAVALYGEDTIQRMVNRASKEAGTNLKSGGKVPVNVHNGEYIIPKNLTKYIGSNVLENMNNRGLMSVGDKTNI